MGVPLAEIIGCIVYVSLNGSQRSPQLNHNHALFSIKQYLIFRHVLNGYTIFFPQLGKLSILFVQFLHFPQTSPWTSPLIVSIQILSFFPLILVVWSCIIGFIAKQLRNWAKRQNESIQRPDVVAKKSSIEKSGIQRWLTFKDTKKEDENSEKRDLTYSKSMVPQVPTEGWKYFGVFTFMYFTCLVSMSMPLFWSIQCVHLDATGKAHLFAGLDTVCF